MNLENAKKALKTYFGYDSFRPMQADIIQAVYDKKDVVVLMPTGGGKSICYQIPAITQSGLCIVVSPLIALMKDQVEGLQANGVAAAFLNSSQTSAQQRLVEKEVLAGKIQLLYISAEKMVSESFLPLLKELKINLIAIDEAHCISSWGHDFRPEYKKLYFLKKQFSIPIIALTATADKVTRRDIIKQLHLEEPKVFISSFDRPNLSLKVLPGRKKLEFIAKFIKEHPNQSGIVYCLSRNSTEKLADKLQNKGINCTFYHAAMTTEARSRVQEDFINDRIPIICATIAFGMGIDKSNIRWVIHYNLPKNIEGYYQEIGRAGRDSVNSETVLFYSYGDVKILREFALQSGQPDLQIAKLNRMQQYAEASICRRKILLNYFGENLQKNCGNCDVCTNPPQGFDGTTIAQMALSAIVRLKQEVGANMLVDVLRGSRRFELIQKGYDKIKTYGAGGQYSFNDWQEYIRQLLNLGYIEIAYDENNVLKITDVAKDVLFKGKKVQLVKMTIVEKAKKERTQKPKSKKEQLKAELFERLRKLRTQIATKLSIPPYLVFSDATLQEMAAEKPAYDYEMESISGVSAKKLKQFGQPFMDLIQAFVIEKYPETSSVKKGGTYLVTYSMYKQGYSPEVIAQQRGLNPVTIYSHIAYLYEKGENIKLARYMSKKELMSVIDAIKTLGGDPPPAKAIFEHLKEAVAFHKIRLGIAYYNRHK